MGRPPLILQSRLVHELLEERRLSVREAARFIGCSRYVVRQRAEQLGIEVLPDTEAAALRRYLTPEPESRCLSPGCPKFSSGYCDTHREANEQLAVEGRICAYPRCNQQPPRGDPYCYGHAKRFT